MARSAAIAAGRATETTLIPDAQRGDPGPDAGRHDYQPVTVEIDGTPTELPLETYVAGRGVAAEIRNDFPARGNPRAGGSGAHLRGLQAVRRPTRRPSGRRPVRRLSPLCSLPRHCGRDRRRYRPVPRAAGGRTIPRAKSLTYDGAPIAAVFHCVSGPRTESAPTSGARISPTYRAWSAPAAPACT